MELVKTSQRETKITVEPERIKHILKNYVDLSMLRVRYLEHHLPPMVLEETIDQNLEIILGFAYPLNYPEVKMYVYSRKFIEFSLVVIEKCGLDRFPPNSYKMRFNSCSVAAVDRKLERKNLEQNNINLINLKVSNVRERELDIIKTMSLHVLVHQYERSLKKYSFGRIFFRDDKDFPKELRFLADHDSMVMIKDLRNYQGYFENAATYFIDRPELKESLAARFDELSGKYKSYLLRPIDYLTLTGFQFPIAYIAIGEKDRELNADDLLEINELAEDIYEKVRIANQTDYKENFKILNLTPFGAMVHVKKKEIIDKILQQDGVLFDISFGETVIKDVAGLIVYILKNSDNSYCLGLNISGSHYGASKEKIIIESLKKYVN